MLSRQSPDVDYVTGATESANAYYWAVIDALSHAKAPVETPAPVHAAHATAPRAGSAGDGSGTSTLGATASLSLDALAAPLAKSGYGQYLTGLLREKRDLR